MKPKFLLLLLLTCYSFFCKAQLTADFPDSNYHWNESKSFIGCEWCPSNIIDGTVYDSATVSINNESYRSLYYKYTSYTIIYAGPFTQISNVFNQTKLVGYIRNDKLNKKVYIIPDSINSQELLLYDFDLKVGDIYPSTFNNKQPDSLVFIHKIDTIIDCYGIQRTRKYISNRGYPLSLVHSGILMEGIGTLTGALGGSISIQTSWVEADCYMYCFTMKNLSYAGLNYMDDSGKCNIHQYLSVENKKRAYISIFPNPANTTFTIDIPYKDATFTIINSIGQSQQIQGIQEGSNWKLDISELENGIYFLIAKTNQQQYYCKLIKN